MNGELGKRKTQKQRRLKLTGKIRMNFHNSARVIALLRCSSDISTEMHSLLDRSPFVKCYISAEQSESARLARFLCF